MGLPSNTNALQNGFAQGYQIGRSLRFRSSASAYLNRTPAAASNRKTWTWSGWVKRGQIGVDQTIFNGWDGSNNATGFYFATNDTIAIFSIQISPTTYSLQLDTTQVFRDPSAWYHIVFALDTTQATASNRAKLYVNGVQVTAFSTATYPSQNSDLFVNTNSGQFFGKRSWANTNYFDGYFAEVNFIDGQQLTPSSFGIYDSNGIWQPIKYTGTYGTNGFYLPFSNTTSTTTLVADASGNGNNWTPNNISLTAGVTYDSMIDSPTVSASSSNYAVLNGALNQTQWAISSPSGTGGTIKNGNLNVVGQSGTWNGWVGTIGMSSSGAYYWEATVVSGVTNWNIGIINEAKTYYQVTASGYSVNDVIGFTFDASSGNLSSYKNGTLTGSLATGLTGVWYPWVQIANSNELAFNFGQRPFSYTPPSGYNALNTANLPQPLISNGANYMAATLWTGNGTSQSIANSQSNGGNNPLGKSFYPDFVWYKGRTTTYNHALFDTIRGTLQRLSSNLTSAETATAGSLTAFNSNGFSIGNDAGANQNTDTYVGWQWLAGAGTTSTNTSGSITSTVSVSAQSGFSVVTYTGNGTSPATVGHGLGVAPDWLIFKNRDAAQNWESYHSVLGATKYMEGLNTTAAAATSTIWNNTSPTSSVFTINGADVNTNGRKYVVYCWAAVKGYSAFGSYTGNGSTDGPFIYTGFRPRFLLAKRTDAAGYDWIMTDSSRSPYNVVGLRLFSNVSDAESSATSPYDFLSNGFKLRNTNANENASGGTYIYMAFAENPFQIARAR